MPIKGGGHHQQKQDIGNGTGSFGWGDLEASKARLAAAMDKVEFLASTKNSLTELSATQTGKAWATIRNNSEPNLGLRRSLSSSIPNVTSMLDSQRETCGQSGTHMKRVSALNRYIVSEEAKRTGPMGAEAARTSARCFRANGPTNFPQYEDLIAPSLKEGQAREPPTLAVKMPLVYRPPAEAFTHGTKSQKSPAGRSRVLVLGGAEFSSGR